MKNEWIKQVENFQLTFENPAKNYKDFDDLIKHRAILLGEEFEEYIDATKQFFNSKTKEEEETALAEMLDAIADMTVINIGTANVLGMDLDEAMRRVYESNMSKLGEDGKPIYNKEGKVQKGPNYHKPKDLKECIDVNKSMNFIKNCSKYKQKNKEKKIKIIVIGE